MESEEGEGVDRRVRRDGDGGGGWGLEREHLWLQTPSR